MTIRLIIFYIFIGIVPASFGQDVLKLEDAIAIALKNNYGILVAQNDAVTTQNNAHRGAAGLLPTVTATAGGNYNNSNVNVEFATTQFPPVEQSGVESTSLNAGINVNYTVYDGMGSQNTFRVLKTQAQLSKMQTRAIIEATISQVANTYYQVARISESYRTLGESAQISADRIQRARDQQAFGSANKLAILNAEVDLNTDSANISTAFFNLENAKRSLNALIGREVDATFDIDREVVFLENVAIDSLVSMAMRNNTELSLAEYNRQVSELNLKIAKSAYAPVLGVTGGYNFNRANNGPGSILKTQQNLGLTVGANVTFNLFTGNQRKINVQNSEIAILNSKYRYDEAKLNLERDLKNAFYTYQSTLRQLELEQKSLEAAEANFARTQDAFKLGQATNVQFREAQLNIQRVKDRLNDFRYTAKLNEIELLRLSGQLVPEG